ncbi:hypothetical protein Athai_59350 [Actinocatenispora thailandica]|uniref:PPM-type phosphatase domain-containing protein n=1 Tax=Actinocatenispora thailandica TaxID=227318 RepID=A0A7R7DW28_9ACTN|nr:protein phosphatase 2C domain-containing protein [Actinocatenispora thailandica]BCJ38432.1 hypothetical protein Athai_59350 [Actinocatenispora thailandica]
MRVTGVSEPRPGKPNEDLLAHRGEVVVVLDGCGVPDSIGGELRRGCRHGVPWYVRSLADELLARAADARETLRDALAGAIEAVTAVHRDECDLSNVDTPACTVTMLRQRGDVLDHLVLSDSSVVFDRRGAGRGIQVVSDDRIAAVRLPGPAIPLDSPARAERDRAGSAARSAKLNRPGGFWVAATDPAAAREALTGSTPVAGVDGVLLATDGATRLVEFGELTWPALLDLAAADPAELVRRTRAAETADPTAIRWPRGKQYDDATAAWCTFV